MGEKLNTHQHHPNSTAAAYLIEVYHDIALRASAAHNILQRQCEEQPPGLRHVQVVGIILVPVLNRCHHLVIICADYLQVLDMKFKSTCRLLRMTPIV